VPWPIVYIAVVRASYAVEMKIGQKRGLTLAEVREAVVLTQVERSSWHFSEDRGWRLYVTGPTYSGARLNVVLYPVDISDGTWDLATAMRAD